MLLDLVCLLTWFLVALYLGAFVEVAVVVFLVVVFIIVCMQSIENWRTRRE